VLVTGAAEEEEVFRRGGESRGDGRRGGGGGGGGADTGGAVPQVRQVLAGAACLLRLRLRRMRRRSPRCVSAPVVPPSDQKVEYHDVCIFNQAGTRFGLPLPSMPNGFHLWMTLAEGILSLFFWQMGQDIAIFFLCQ
jgi:hypothetical protein